jgi:hypothetical protein
MINLTDEVTDAKLREIGFSDYDDEHCTWGNRRLRLKNSVLQIIDQEDDEYTEQKSGFFYAGWFTSPYNGHPKNNDYRELKSVQDIYDMVHAHHDEEDFEYFKTLLNHGKDLHTS